MLTISYTSADGLAQEIVLDASLSEQYTANVQITDHPVESTANISDHVRPLPKTLRVEGILADQPTGIAALDRGYKGRAAALFAQLEDLRDAGTAVVVVTPVKRYANILIQDVSKTRDRNAGESGNGSDANLFDLVDPRAIGGHAPEDRTASIRFTMSLKQVILVDSQTVAIAKAAQGTVDTGPKQGEKPPTGVEQTALLQIGIKAGFYK